MTSSSTCPMPPSQATSASPGASRTSWRGSRPPGSAGGASRSRPPGTATRDRARWRAHSFSTSGASPSTAPPLSPSARTAGRATAHANWPWPAGSMPLSARAPGISGTTSTGPCLPGTTRPARPAAGSTTSRAAAPAPSPPSAAGSRAAGSASASRARWGLGWTRSCSSRWSFLAASTSSLAPHAGGTRRGSSTRRQRPWRGAATPTCTRTSQSGTGGAASTPSPLTGSGARSAAGAGAPMAWSPPRTTSCTTSSLGSR
mmetsp:Transcript_11340/g.30949  ORF Transcript_11340/g.30949 Transcript_11340/m.30949 type:complete len:259 (-) Transcript_11340:1169-1945(-)